jgi:hypothetical protein
VTSRRTFVGGETTGIDGVVHHCVSIRLTAVVVLEVAGAEGAAQSCQRRHFKPFNANTLDTIENGPKVGADP